MVLLSLSVMYTKWPPFQMQVTISTITDMEVARTNTGSLDELANWLERYKHLKPVLKPVQWDMHNNVQQDASYMKACADALKTVLQVTCTDWTLAKSHELNFEEATRYAEVFATTYSSQRKLELLERIATALEQNRS